MATIGVHTHITNPLSFGYLSYLACVESWARVADEVVVVDGGSTDNSISLLMDWLGPLARKVKIITTPETYWGAGEQWFWPQIAINRQVGYAALQTDWAIHVDADHVLSDVVTRELLETECARATDSYVYSFWVSDFAEGRLRHRIRTRSWIVNKRKASENGITVAYGIDVKSRTHLDYPLIVRKGVRFLDPLTNVQKQFLAGDYVAHGGILNIDMFRYGHFFFTFEQCLYKCERLDRVLSRYVGRAPTRALGLLLEPRQVSDRIVVDRGGNRLSKESVLSWQHPAGIKRTLSFFWMPEMIGSLISQRHPLRGKIEHGLFQLLRIERRLRTAVLRLQGFRGALDRVSFVPIEDFDSKTEPLDVAKLYSWQNRYLPPWDARLPAAKQNL